MIIFNTHIDNRRRNFLLVVGVGLAFFLVFTAFSTASQANESVLEGARKEYGDSFTASGYLSLALVYVGCATFNCVSPFIVSWIKPKFGMLIGSLAYIFFLSVFIKPLNWLIYLASVIVGCGAAVLWTAQGVFITACSNERNLSQNFGIFWILFQTSTLIGGLFAYFYLTNVTSITSTVRVPMYAVLCAIGSGGCLLFFFLPSPKADREQMDAPRESGSVNEASPSAVSDATMLLPGSNQNRDSGGYTKPTIAQCFRLLKTPIMLAILVATCFTGINVTFYSGVYGTCLSRMMAFGARAKSYIGLAGIFIGCGGLIGGQVTAHSGDRIHPAIVVVVAFVSAILSALLSFLMVPAEAPIRETSSTAFIQPSVYLAMFVAFLLGLNDSLWNAQISVLIGKAFPTDRDAAATATAFALFKFTQSIASAIAFFYSSVLYLHWQVLIFACCAIVGIGCLLFAQRKSAVTHHPPAMLPQL